MASFSVYTENREVFPDNSEDEEETDEALDPRVKGELERLNSSTAEINRLEQGLEEMHALFRQTLTESAFVLKSESNRLGKLVQRSRPYYDAVEKAKQVQTETQRAALKYERACSKLQSAKEMVSLAERKLASTSTEHKILDPTWQEMLNKATMKVMNAEQERRRSETEHLETARAFTRAGKTVSDLKGKLKLAINKSKTYFALKSKYMNILEAHKHQIGVLQEDLQEAKKNYSLSLKSLEGISDEIHEMRKSRDNLLDLCFSSKREDGVGAEAPSPDSSYEGSNIVRHEEFGFSIALISNSSSTHSTAPEQAYDNADTDGLETIARVERTVCQGEDH